MKFYLIPSTGIIVNSIAECAGEFWVQVNEQGNSCMYNGDAFGHSKGFCTANACY